MKKIRRKPGCLKESKERRKRRASSGIQFRSKIIDGKKIKREKRIEQTEEEIE
ncbi:MAG: hypothetical protein LBC99_06145 [Spirochaetota bacterium]|jgi:hypothetical protein|nr:hypothetical protein [Spirochaetota bacterium]